MASAMPVFWTLIAFLVVGVIGTIFIPVKGPNRGCVPRPRSRRREQCEPLPGNAFSMLACHATALRRPCS